MKAVSITIFLLVIESILLLLVMSRNPSKNVFTPVPSMFEDDHVPIKVIYPEPNKSGRGPFNYEEWHVNKTKPKKTIKIKVVDFWGPDPTNENPQCLLCWALSRMYNLEFSENPDFLFYSVNGKNHLKYDNCVKIFFSNENLVPNFNYCDYAISQNYIDFNGRHFRYSPLSGRKYVFKNFPEAGNLDRNMTKRKFCNFVYKDNKMSLEGVRLRGKFFKLLSKYRHVDSPGKVFNNMKNVISPRTGDWHSSKLEFIKDYKFTIAFENSNTDDYTTEKLPDALFTHSIPIYFGNPKVGLEYNKKAFIHVNDYDSLEDVVKKVIELDNDDDAYMAMLNEPPLLYPEYDYSEEMEKFLSKIIERGNKPFTKDPFGFTKRKQL